MIKAKITILIYLLRTTKPLTKQAIWGKKFKTHTYLISVLAKFETKSVKKNFKVCKKGNNKSFQISN